MGERGLDLTRHEAQPVTDQLVRHSDLIVTMTLSHRQAIVERWPEAAERTVLLLPGKGDIPDPIGQTLGAYRECAEEIAAGLEHHLPRLKSEL
jgi:protein-tyrosine-phosphatase